MKTSLATTLASTANSSQVQELFLKNFAHLADSPDGIKKLRELILQLAIQGKLVPQNPNDETASELLKKIKTEKERLVKEKIIRKSKALETINADEHPFDLPNSWRWIKLNEIGDWGAGSTPKRGNSELYNGDINWYKSGELNGAVIDYDSVEKVSELALKSSSLRLNQVGDVLIAMYGATIGKTAILAKTGTTNQAVCACTCFEGYGNDFLHILLKAYKRIFTDQGAGGAQPNISRVKIINTVAPLPPLAEQKRIVAKVDQLMALCDQLEEAQQKRTEVNQSLLTSALNSLHTSQNSKEFDTAWKRLADNFAPLFPATGSIRKSSGRGSAKLATSLGKLNLQKLRQTILQLAVQGKLVPQDPKDEPASVLLERIATEKARLIKEKKIKKGKSIEVITPAEIPYQAPNLWSWCKLQDILLSAYTGIDKGKTLQSPDFQYPYFKMNNISNSGSCDFDNVTNINATEEEVIKYSLEVGDFLFNTRNSAELVGKTCVFQSNDKSKWLFNNNILKINFHDSITNNFINCWFWSKTGKDILDEFKSSTTNVAAIYQGKLMNYVMPIPPLAEQKRIVAKVDQLMTICDQLEAALDSALATQQKLTTSLIHHLEN